MSADCILLDDAGSAIANTGVMADSSTKARSGTASCIRLGHDRVTTANVLQSTAVLTECNCIREYALDYHGIVALSAPCACRLHALLARNVQLKIALDWATPRAMTANVM